MSTTFLISKRNFLVLVGCRTSDTAPIPKVALPFDLQRQNNKPTKRRLFVPKNINFGILQRRAFSISSTVLHRFE